MRTRITPAWVTTRVLPGCLRVRPMKNGNTRSNTSSKLSPFLGRNRSMDLPRRSKSRGCCCRISSKDLPSHSPKWISLSRESRMIGFDGQARDAVSRLRMSRLAWTSLNRISRNCLAHQRAWVLPSWSRGRSVVPMNRRKSCPGNRPWRSRKIRSCLSE